MKLYGIGRALVDFFPQWENPSERQTFENILLQLYSQNQGKPLHIEERDFDRILKRFSDTGNCTFLQEVGGTCTNILKTVIHLISDTAHEADESSIHTFFTGTVGGSSVPPRPNFLGKRPDTVSIPESLPGTNTEALSTERKTLYRDPLALFFQKELGLYGIQSALRMEQGSTGRCLVVPAPAKVPVPAPAIKVSTPVPATKVSTPAPERDTTPTATAWIAAVSPGVSPSITREQIVLQELQSADCCVIEGMQLGNPALDALLQEEVLQKEKYLAIACGTPWGAKAAAHFIQQYCIGTMAQKYKLMVFCNDAEGRTMEEAGINFFRLTENPMWLFVVTHDCGGSSTYYNQNHFFQEAATPTAPIVDPTGAGDVFAGTCLACWARNIATSEPLTASHITNALREASYKASRILQYPLCQTSFL